MSHLARTTAAKMLEQQVIDTTSGRTYLVWDVIESSDRFVTFTAQRIKADGTIWQADMDQTRVVTVAWSHITRLPTSPPVEVAQMSSDVCDVYGCDQPATHIVKNEGTGATIRACDGDAQMYKRRPAHIRIERIATEQPK